MKKNVKILYFLALGIFLVSLFLPALDLSLSGAMCFFPCPNEGPMYGLIAFVFAPLYLLYNFKGALLILTSSLMANYTTLFLPKLLKKSKKMILYNYLLLFFVSLPLRSLSYIDLFVPEGSSSYLTGIDFLPGYYLWLGAHLVAGVCYFLYGEKS